MMSDAYMFPGTRFPTYTPVERETPVEVTIKNQFELGVNAKALGITVTEKSQEQIQEDRKITGRNLSKAVK